MYKEHEFILWNIVEEHLEVDIHDVCVFIIDVFKQFDDCLLCSALWSKPITVLAK